MTYTDKLKDPRWQKKRLKILERDNWTCQNCGNTENTLTVHHFHYEKNPCDTIDNQLITLCQDCHKKVQTGQDAINFDISILISNNYKILPEIYGILDYISSFDSNQIRALYNIIENVIMCNNDE